MSERGHQAHAIDLRAPVRCQAFEDTAKPITQCWNDYGHDGEHRWLSDNDWITWPQHINLIDRIKRKVVG